MQFTKEGKTTHNQSEYGCSNKTQALVQVKDHSQLAKEQQKKVEEKDSKSQLRLIEIKQKKQNQEQYSQFFMIVKQQLQNFKLENLSKQTLEKHKIKIISSKGDQSWQKLVKEGYSYVEPTNSYYNGLQCQYNVIIGRFLLTVNVLNLHINSLNTRNDDDQLLGKGSFGTVTGLTIGQKKIALKKIKFLKILNLKTQIIQLFNKSDFSEWTDIRRGINQYCLYKICSMLQIGPQVNFQNCYDLVCYNDCIQFQIQYCEQVQKGTSVKKYENDIKRCLGILHSLKIIHKDIKRQNTLYSPTFSSFVLSDFGLTHSVKQQIWQKTETCFAGSITYSSQQMKRLLYDHQVGLVNLYLNDVHGLARVIQQMKFQEIQYGSNFAQNEMSIGENLYGSEDYAEQVEYSEQFYIEDYNSNPYSAEKSQDPNIKNIIAMYNKQNQLKQSQNTKDTIKYLSIRVIWTLLREKVKKLQKQEKQKKIKQISETVLNGINKKERSEQERKKQKLKEQIIKFSNWILNSQLSQQNGEAAKICNTIRMFGTNSYEARKALKQVCQSRSIANLNYSLIENYLNLAKQQPKLVINKLKIQLMNKDRHFSLRNKKSAANSIKSLLNNYLANHENVKSEKQQILIFGLEALTFEDLTTLEFLELASLLALAAQNRKIGAFGITIEVIADLADKIFEECQGNDKLKLKLLQSCVKVCLRCRKQQRAQCYQEKTSQLRAWLEGQLKSEQQKQEQRIRQLKLSIIKSWLVQIQYLSYVNNYKLALQQSERNYKLFTEYQLQDSVTKINCLQKIVICLTNLSRFQEASKILQEVYILLEKTFFPNKNSLQFATYYSQKGIISTHQQKYQQALQYFQMVLQCNQDVLRGSNHIFLVKQTLHNMFACYSKLNKFDQALQLLKQLFQIQANYVHFGNYESAIRVCERVIIFMLKFGCEKPALGYYIGQMAKLRFQYLSNNRSDILKDQLKNRQFFTITNLQANKIPLQSRMMFFSISAKAIQPYLPAYLTWFIAVNRTVIQYHTQKNNRLMSLPYYWNFLKYLPRNQRNVQYYLMVIIFSAFLHSYHSNRRAYHLIKRYLYEIPGQMKSLKQQSFQSLTELSNIIEVKEKQFNQFMSTTPQIYSFQRLSFYINNIEHIPCTDKFKAMVWRKKLQKIRNSFQPEKNSQAEIKTEGQNPENSLGANQKKIQEMTTEDKIYQKLKLAKLKRQKEKYIKKQQIEQYQQKKEIKQKIQEKQVKKGEQIE